MLILNLTANGGGFFGNKEMITVLVELLLNMYCNRIHSYDGIITSEISLRTVEGSSDKQIMPQLLNKAFSAISIHSKCSNCHIESYNALVHVCSCCTDRHKHTHELTTTIIVHVVHAPSSWCVCFLHYPSMLHV